MFPIWDDTIPKTGVTPRVAYILIAINILVFLYQASLSPTEFEAFVMSFGTIPKAIMSWEATRSLLTNMFLHGSWMHLWGNMLFLWVFGDNIEARMGNIKFLLFYVAWGIVAALAHIFLNLDSTIPAVGASGAISAVLWEHISLCFLILRSRWSIHNHFVSFIFLRYSFWDTGLWFRLFHE